jgi:hypothetical protein
MSGDAGKEQRVEVKQAGRNGAKSSYERLQAVRTELDLAKCSEDIENDLLEASLEEYQYVVC